MIKINNTKFTAKKAAMLMILHSMENFGWEQSQIDLLETMTDADKKSFMIHYADIYSSLAVKVGVDDLTPEQLLIDKYK